MVGNGVGVGAAVFVGMGSAVGSGLGTGVLVAGGGGIGVDVEIVSMASGMAVFSATSFCGAACWQAEAINVKMTNIKRVNRLVILKKHIVKPP